MTMKNNEMRGKDIRIKRERGKTATSKNEEIRSEK